jgi:hypothetical protein
MPSTAQPTPETGEKKSRGLGSYVVWAFLALMVYVLSSGPAIARLSYGWPGTFLMRHYTIPTIPGRCTIYDPLFWVYDHTLLHKPLGLYWRIWDPESFHKNGDSLM